MKHFRVAIHTILVLLFVAVIVAPSRSVQAAGGLTVSPPLKEITLGPGLISTNFDVTLKNTTGVAVLASYKLVDLKSLGQYGGNTLDKAGLPDSYDLTSWMSLTHSDKQRVANGETATIQVKIDNRSDLSPGGHYGAVIITTTPEDGKSDSISLNQQIISLVFVKKLGGEIYGLSLEPLKPRDSSKIPDSVELVFKSTGNVHVTPRGFVEVTDPSGKLIAKGIINSDSSIVLPGASRKFVTIMQPVSSATDRGEYKITVRYRYEGEDKFSTQTITFNRGYSPKNMFFVAIPVAVVTIGTAFLWKTRRKQQR